MHRFILFLTILFFIGTVPIVYADIIEVEEEIESALVNAEDAYDYAKKAHEAVSLEEAKEHAKKAMESANRAKINAKSAFNALEGI